MKFKPTFITIASSALLATGLAHAADTTAVMTAQPANMTDRQMAKSGNMKADREQLQRKLVAGKSRADYEKILRDNGYRISAINEDKKDYLEYEVVKGRSSYEVQIDFKNGAAMATKIEVDNNMWRAEATERMMKDENYQQAGALVADPKGRYSDRRYMKSWTDEKDSLEKSLPKNLKGVDYRSKLEGMGYKVTSVNDRDKDYVEYEIAKGENSYEVQIDLDAKTGMAKKIDVTSNLWETDATDRVTDRAKEMKK